MTEKYRIRVAGDSLAFASAHFITYEGDICEALHGHNFRVAIEVAGALDENHYVFDFVALKAMLLELLSEWDHRVLLPTEHEQIRLEIDENEVEARFAERRWVFPRSQCALIPVPNTTVELLARCLAERLRERLAARTGGAALTISVEIEESPGFTAVCQLNSA